MRLKTSEIEFELSNTARYKDLYLHYGYKELKEKIQPALLQVLIDFDTICRNADIFYVITAGTLLGAVREGAFISWDDDIDVLVKADDIVKIKDAIKSSGFDEKYVYISPEESIDITLDGKFQSKYVTWGKLLDDEKMNYDLYIDVLPIENAPDNFILYNIKSFFSNLLVLSYNSMRVTKKNDELLEIMSHDCRDLKLNLFFRRFVALPLRIIGKKNAYKLIKKISSFQSNKTKRVTIPFGVLRYRKETLPRSVFEKSVSIILEGAA